MRRCEIEPDEARRFPTELLFAYRNFPKSQMVNADEPMSLMFGQPRRTLAEKAAKSVKVEVNGDSKATMT
jgi:hypothetical protein